MGSLPPLDFGDLLARLTRELEARHLPFMLIGGQAVLLHGRPRLTEDIDVTLGVGPGELAAVMAAAREMNLQALPEDPERFVRETFVLPSRDVETGIRIDFIFSTTPYERQAITRALRVTVAGTPVPFATAEDLVIHKLFAARATDWEDAVSVVRRKGPELDWAYVEHWVREFGEVPGRDRMPDDLRRLRRDAS